MSTVRISGTDQINCCSQAGSQSDKPDKMNKLINVRQI
jgi:hypothetical protein